MLTEKPAVPITKPLGQPVAVPKVELPPEGTAIINRPCTLHRDTDSDWFVLKIEDARNPKEAGLLWVMPCQYLGLMKEQFDKDSTVIFRVSGETFLYQDRAFILPEKVTVETPVATQPKALPTTGPAATGPSATGPSSRPTTQVAIATPEDVIAALLKSGPVKPLLLSVQKPPTDASPSVAPAGGDAPIAAEVVIDRVIRIVDQPSTTWTLARFESDNTLRDPPLMILPGTVLAKAQDVIKENLPPAGSHKLNKSISRTGYTAMHDPFSSMQFKVSGQITYYNGRRYLILRRCERLKDLGQF